MRLLITGGAGFIGSHLAELCIREKAEVWIIDDLSTGSLDNIQSLLPHPNFHFVKGTVLDREAMVTLVGTCDIVLHLAAAVGVKLVIDQPLESMHTNIFGTELTLELADKFRKKVFITSTSEIYGCNDKVPLSEDDYRIYGSTTIARWSYAGSKAMDEFLALAYAKVKGLPVVIARLFNTVGPRQTGRYGMVIPRFVRQALQGEPITVYGDGRQTRSFTYVGDVVRAIFALIQEPKAVGEIFNIGGDHEITIADLAQRVKRLTGSASKIRLVPYEEAYEQGFEDMRRRVPNTGKIKSLIDFQNRLSIDEILCRVIDSERQSLGRTPTSAAHEAAAN
ncbi:MAG: GDP-mannose 4,6-dehydratase [Acidobacteria bacterium]|nr:GDP-mannose 4,6-dehydratase [Acidobacteriota bacterium]MBI3657600.1 GDP-mannose 4,6-dehydratase [Acidobacteriota bacterium]